MAKKDVEAIQFTSKFSFMGTIERFASFASKGGGLSLAVQTSDDAHLPEIARARGAAVRITVEVSASTPDTGYDGDQLDFDGINDGEDDDGEGNS